MIFDFIIIQISLGFTDRCFILNLTIEWSLLNVQFKLLGKLFNWNKLKLESKSRTQDICSFMKKNSKQPKVILFGLTDDVDFINSNISNNLVNTSRQVWTWDICIKVILIYQKI